MGALKSAAAHSALALSRLPGLTRAPIVMYHAIDGEHSELCVSPANFRDQVAWLADNGFRTVSLDDYLQALEGPGLGALGRAAVLTFDDGYVNNLEHAVPALAERGFSATLFIPTGCVGDVTRWLPRQWPVMTWEQIAECRAAGMVIGAHTVNHPHLADLSADEARREMEESRDALQQRLGEEIGWLCYPYGSHSAETERIAQDLGFRGAVSVKEGNWNGPGDRHRLRRTYVGPTTDVAHFALGTSRLWSWKKRLGGGG